MEQPDAQTHRDGSKSANVQQPSSNRFSRKDNFHSEVRILTDHDVANDVDRDEASTLRLHRADALGGSWICVSERTTCWMVPANHLRLSAGVPSKTIRPCVVISTCLGEILLLELNRRFSFVVLSSFLDGLCAVRERFERELEEGRRACTTGEERVANLRKCREAMNAYSDRVVTEHMKVLPVKWKDSPRIGNFDHPAVVRLTSPDGHLVTSGDETNVAVLGYEWQLVVRFSKDGSIQGEWEHVNISRTLRNIPANNCTNFHTKAFRQHYDDGTVNMIRYVRDPHSNTDAIKVSEVMKLRYVGKRRMLPIGGGGGATGRWLVFIAFKWGSVIVFETETGQMAHLRTPSLPNGATETHEGLWMWGVHPSNYDGWSKLFKVEALQSLAYTDPSYINEPPQVVQRPVVDTALDAEAFRQSGLSPQGRIRNKNRHPGHYWVVAGYGPVPTRLRAPDHIFTELERAEQLSGYRGFPFWSASENSWSVFECDKMPCFSPTWAGAVELPLPAYWVGAVDVRDDVTADSINEDPKTDTWRVGVSIQDEILERNGDFTVTGDTLSAWSSTVFVEVPVTAGRWLWRLKARTDDDSVELTLWHESISDMDIAKCTARTRPADLAKFKSRLAQLSALEPLIPEEGLRAKIGEFTEWVCPLVLERARSRSPLMVLDKEAIRKQTTDWYALSDNQVEVIPLSCGVALHFGHRSPTFFLGENMIRISMK